MTTFQTLSDLPVDEKAEYDRILAIAEGLRSTTEAAFLTARAGYVDSEVLSNDDDDNIETAKGNTLPTGYSGFAKGAIFIKKDAADGTKARYENVGTTAVASWNLIGEISSVEIGAKQVKTANIDDKAVDTGQIADSAVEVLQIANNAVETAKVKDLNITAEKLAAALDLREKDVQLAIKSATPINAVAAAGILTLAGDVVENETFTIGSRVYEIDSDGSIAGSSDVAVDVSGGAVGATGILTLTNPVIDGETILIDGRVYEIDADSSITGDVAVDVSGGTKVQAAGVLSIPGVVIDGETVTIGGEVYEFDANSSVGGGNTAVDVSASMTAAEGALTLGGAAPANDETITVGSQTYTWKTTLTGAANEIKIGSTVDDCIDNFVYAVNAGVGAGTLYGTGTSANASASAVKTSGTVATLTAKLKGTVGDSVATTETMGDGANIFDAATLGTTTAGVDCAAAAAVTALVAAFNGGTALAITASDGAGDTVDFDADAAGALDGSAGNATATTEAMANGSFANVTLTGGTDATAAEAVTAIALAITNDGSSIVAAVDGAGDTVDLTADEEGTVGNAITTTETLANGSFGGVTLSGGTDEGAANAVTAIVTAINGDGSAEVTAADGALDTVDLTAKTKGVAGDAIVTTEMMSNGSFGAVTLENGVDGTVGLIREIRTDTAYIYMCIAANTIADANWRRVDIGSAY